MYIECSICGKKCKTFPSRSRKQFCSRECQGIAFRKSQPRQFIDRECPNCKQMFSVDSSQIRAGYGKFCSRKCTHEYYKGERNPRYRGGYLRSDGYREVGRNLHHRLVMEAYLERPLSRNEHVHHINGNKLDNRIENLQLQSASAHMSYHGKGRKHTDDARQNMSCAASRRSRNDKGQFA